MECAGNTAETCGGGNRLSVYVLSTTGTTTTKPATTTTKAATTPAAQASGFPAGWANYGCYSEGTTGRMLPNQMPDNTAQTLNTCVAACVNAGYTIAGAEYGTQCMKTPSNYFFC